MQRCLHSVRKQEICLFAVVFSQVVWGAPAATARADEGSWPQFRGPDATGVVAGHSGLPSKWSASENVRWKREIAGRGWSSPVVHGSRVFLTTVVSEGEVEAAKKGLYFGGERRETPDANHHWKVLCLDLDTGNVLWERQVHEGQPATPLHVKNSYASETPVTDGQRVYAYFGNVGIFCLNVDGDLLWEHPIEPRKTRMNWGPAASAVLCQGRLYIVNDNEEESYLVALDAETGDQLWRTTRDEKSNWSTPYIWQNERRTEIVTPGTQKVRSYDLDGNLLYEFSGCSVITIATPYSQHGLLYISSGYVLDPRRPLFAIRPGAVGDISLQDGQTENEFIAWCQPDAAPYNPSTIVYGDLLYVLYDRGFFACFDAKSGEVIYEKKRIPGGRAFTSSPWAYDDKIFCLNEDGVTFVISAGRDFEVLGTNELAEDDMCMATPAIPGDRLLVRSAVRLYCLQKANE
jgi:outer membrane protein assembly factor BamB